MVIERAPNDDGPHRARGRSGHHRQLAALEHAARTPSAVFTAQSLGGSYRVTTETARQDLQGLDARGLLRRIKIGKEFAWALAAGLAERP